MPHDCRQLIIKDFQQSLWHCSSCMFGVQDGCKSILILFGNQKNLRHGQVGFCDNSATIRCRRDASSGQTREAHSDVAEPVWENSLRRQSEKLRPILHAAASAALAGICIKV